MFTNDNIMSFTTEDKFIIGRSRNIETECNTIYDIVHLSNLYVMIVNIT